jgi:hypothetical protein
MAGVSLLDTSSRTTSMLQYHTTAIIQLSLPRLNPTMLIFDSTSTLETIAS